MKKPFLFLIVLFVNNMIFSQNLPKVVPVSPEAASLGKYGNIPVNLATGRVNYTIPIFTIKEGDFELPIYLSYNHSGLLAEEDPGVVGLGWTLHAGGAISRQLRGKPDEGTLGYLKQRIGKEWVIPYKNGVWNGLSNSQKRSKMSTLFKGSDSGELDTQPDQFIINSSGISATFSYDENEEVIFYPHKNYTFSSKLTKDDFFIFKDDKGLEYEFKAKETSSLENISGGTTTNFETYISSWKLTNILLPNGKTIKLNYTAGTPYQKIGYSESQFIPRSLTNNSFCSSVVNLSVNKSMSITDIETQKISDICFSSGCIEFVTGKVPLNSKSRNKDYLRRINVKNKYGEIINYYEFVFDNLNSNFKLLKEIKKFNSKGDQEPFFKLEYKGTPPIEIKYSSQDDLGFYNGSVRSSLLDKKSGPSFQYASLGALNKIIYPTGGYTKIEYESNRVDAIGEIDPCKNLPKANTYEELLDNTADFDGATTKQIYIEEAQKVTLHMSALAYSSNSVNNEPIRLEAFASISGNLRCAVDSELDKCGFSCNKEISTIYELGNHLNGGNKRVKAIFSVPANTTLTLSVTLEGNGAGQAYAGISFYDPKKSKPDTPSKVVNSGYETSGLRVEKIEDCTTGKRCVSRSFRYVLDDGSTSGRFLFSPEYENLISHSGPQGNCSFTQKTSFSKIPLSSYIGAPVFYNRVEILNNLNEKQVNHYSWSLNSSPLFPFLPINNKDWKKGYLTLQKTYKKNGKKI